MITETPELSDEQRNKLAIECLNGLDSNNNTKITAKILADSIATSIYNFNDDVFNECFKVNPNILLDTYERNNIQKAKKLATRLKINIGVYSYNYTLKTIQENIKTNTVSSYNYYETVMKAPELSDEQRDKLIIECLIELQKTNKVKKVIGFISYMAQDNNIYSSNIKNICTTIINKYTWMNYTKTTDILSKFNEKGIRQPQIYYNKINTKLNTLLDDNGLKQFIKIIDNNIVDWVKNNIINILILDNNQQNDLINKYLLALDKRNKTDKVIELIDYITCDDTFKYNNTVRNTCLAIADKYAKQDLMSDTTIINMISKFAEKDKKEAEIYYNKLNMLLDAENTAQFTREIGNDVVNWAKNNIINATIINNDQQNDLINKYLLGLDQMGKTNKVIDLINYIAQDNTFEYNNTVNDLCIKIATEYNEKNLMSDKKKNNIILKFTEKYSSAMREEISEESRVELSQEQKQVSNQQVSQKLNQETNQILGQITNQELTRRTNQKLGFDFEQDQESLFSK